MTNSNVSPEFREHVHGASDATPTPDVEKADEWNAFLQDAQLAGATGLGASAAQHVANFREETRSLDEQFAAHYKKIADAAKRKPAPANDPARLEKRFDEKAGYRQFFRDRLAKGKTPTEILDGYLAEFPHANPDVIALLWAVATEFA